MTVTNNIYQKPIKYHVFNAVTNSELTELVPVFTIRPALLTSVKKVNTAFKNVWRTWGPALPTLLADLMIFCPLGPMNFKNSVISMNVLVFSPVSSSNKTDRHDITEILLKVTLNTITFWALG